MKNCLLLIATTLILTGCASAKLVTPSQTDVDRITSKFPDYTLAELNEGNSLYSQNCNNCHNLKDPASRTEAQWKKIVPEMSAKANKKAPNSLNSENQEKILKYLITMSTAPKSK